MRRWSIGNSAALLFVGGYLLLVTWYGRQDELVELLRKEKGFLLWLSALIILWTLIQALPRPVQTPAKWGLVGMVALQAAPLAEGTVRLIDRLFGE